MQNYTEISEDTTLEASRELLLNNDKTAMTNSAATTAPSTPMIGQSWFNTSTNEFQIWNGSAWVNTGITTVATPTADGLMSSADKSKLDGIADNANNYSLPIATASTPGGVMIGSGISIDTSGKISVKTAGTATYFYTSGTYTVPAGVTTVYVSGCGGGAGGGHFYGGGGGESVIRKAISVTPGESIYVTIGSGGAGKPTSAGTISTFYSGNHGGDTKFGSYLTLSGGYAAKINSSSAKLTTWPRGGGNGATMGKTSYMQTVVDYYNVWGGGDGGSSLFGVGGTGAFFDQGYASTTRYIAANDGVGYGAGGGSSCELQSANWASAAGSGSNGILIVEVV